MVHQSTSKPSSQTLSHSYVISYVTEWFIVTVMILRDKWFSKDNNHFVCRGKSLFPQLQVLSIVPWNSWYILSVTEGVFDATDLQIVKIITQNLTLLKSDTTTIYNHLVLNLNRKKRCVWETPWSSWVTQGQKVKFTRSTYRKEKCPIWWGRECVFIFFSLNKLCLMIYHVCFFTDTSRATPGTLYLLFAMNTVSKTVFLVLSLSSGTVWCPCPVWLVFVNLLSCSL